MPGMYQRPLYAVQRDGGRPHTAGSVISVLNRRRFSRFSN